MLLKKKSIISATIKTLCLTIVLLNACSPTIKIEAPDKPIHFVVDLNIKQEVLLKVEKDIDNVSVSPQIPMAKKSGWIGERPDGYLGTVEKNAPKEMKDLVLKVNEERRKRYERISKEHKVEIASVESLAGKRFIEKSSRGEFIMNENEKWIRKD